jgi:hypothetical protein
VNAYDAAYCEAPAPDFDALSAKCLTDAIGAWGYDPQVWQKQTSTRTHDAAIAVMRAHVADWLTEDGASAADVAGFRAGRIWQAFAADLATEAANAAREALDDCDGEVAQKAAEVLDAMGLSAPDRFFDCGMAAEEE